MRTEGNGRGKVLVIDDDAIATSVARARLESAGYDVVTRNEALGTSCAVVHEHPDAILMDLHMPALDGDQLALLIQRLPAAATIPIILCSSEPEATLRGRAAATAVAGCICKTTRDAEFIRRFDEILNTYRRRAT